MITTTTIDELRSAVRSHRDHGRSVGLVPTMGFLHAGHASLMDASVRDNDVTIVSVFVNPLQFAPDEDLDRYPRDPEGDTALAAQHGVDIVFIPEPDQMYPRPNLTSVSVAEISDAMEGSSRPTHFTGVATVVTKLFNICGADRAYFGEKDYQQLAVVRRMVADLNQPTTIVGCPTVREADGLARSSRNVYLTPEERAVAPILHQALTAGATAIRDGATAADEVKAMMASMITSAPLGTLDYVDIADADTLVSVADCRGSVRLFGAVQFSRARLIDNIGLDTIDTTGGSVA